MKITVEKLRKCIEELFISVGLVESDASLVTSCLLEAELAGISTHGVSMVPAHIKKCQKGYDLKAKMIIEKETSAFSMCNANNSIGMLSAWSAIKLAVERSSTTGIYAVFCHNANTFSAAYCYAKYAVEHGKIAIVTCNSPAQMAPFGGKDKLLGTNPLAIGIPGGKEDPFILDMATSAVAKSKINQAVRSGDKKIPFGWATDINGNPTDNPVEAVKGLILPMAGPKGYGLSMAIDILSGVLAHAAYLDDVKRFYSEDNSCMNVGHSFLVMDPVLIYGEDFYDIMDEYLKKIRMSQSVSKDKILVPGDINVLARNEALEHGVEVPTNIIQELNILLNLYGRDLI